MTDQRREINELIRELTALLEQSAAEPGSKTIAALMVASIFARRTDMPPHLAAAMLANFYVKGPLAQNEN
jgi:hypothetical protein